MHACILSSQIFSKPLSLYLWCYTLIDRSSLSPPPPVVIFFLSCHSRSFFFYFFSLLKPVGICLLLLQSLGQDLGFDPSFSPCWQRPSQPSVSNSSSSSNTMAIDNMLTKAFDFYEKNRQLEYVNIRINNLDENKTQLNGIFFIIVRPRHDL